MTQQGRLHLSSSDKCEVLLNVTMEEDLVPACRLIGGDQRRCQGQEVTTADGDRKLS